MNTPSLQERPPEADKIQPHDPFAVSLDADALIRRTVRGSFSTVLSQGAKLFIQIGSQIILARLLFPAEFGLIAMAFPVVAFIQVFNDIGLGQAIVQRPTLASEQVSALFWVNIAISSALVLVVALLAPLAAWAYAEPRVVPLMIVLGLTLPISALSILPAALLARHMRFGVIARNEVMSMLAGTVVTIIAATQGLSYWSLVLGQLVNALVGNILTWSASRWKPSWPVFNASVWADVKFGGNITLSNLATFITTSGDNIIVGLTVGKVSLGLYDRSYNLVVRPVAQMMAPLSRVAVPLLSRLASQETEYRAAYLQMFRTATLLVVPGMLVCQTYAAPLIHVFLGPRWSPAAPIFSWICVGGLTSGIYQSAYWLFISQGRSQELKYFSAVAAVINVASYLIGALWGVVGIATAAALGFVFLTTPLMLFGAARRGPVRSVDIAKCAAPFLVEGLLVYAALVLGVSKIAVQGFFQIVTATLISYGLFIALSLTSRANRQLMGGALRSLKGLLPA